MTNTYDIATETGGKFCECTKQGEEVLLIGKEGQLSLTKLIVDFRQYLRRRKFRGILCSVFDKRFGNNHKQSRGNSFSGHIGNN